MKSSHQIFDSADHLAKTAAETIEETGRAMIDHNGQFTLVLSGGSTPAATYKHLISSKLDWSKVHLFWGDERSVISTHPDSNYHLAFENLIKHIDIPGDNVHRVASEEDTMLAAQQYQDEILYFFGMPEGSWPSFDLILLGLGDDGHTASLFPQSDAVSETASLVVENHVKKLNTRRITFTLPLINAAKKILFLVAGDAKSTMVHRILKNIDVSEPVPAQLVNPTAGEVVWYLDKSAARQLN